MVLIFYTATVIIAFRYVKTKYHEPKMSLISEEAGTSSRYHFFGFYIFFRNCCCCCHWTFINSGIE